MEGKKIYKTEERREKTLSVPSLTLFLLSSLFSSLLSSLTLVEDQVLDVDAEEPGLERKLPRGRLQVLDFKVRVGERSVVADADKVGGVVQRRDRGQVKVAADLLEGSGELVDVARRVDHVLEHAAAELVEVGREADLDVARPRGGLA